jgi:methylmalonyl-CoA mutase N-terminal domain/subunit
MDAPGTRRQSAASTPTSGRRRAFTTHGGIPVRAVYTPDDLAGFDYARDLGDPGSPPYTRGIHRTGYRGKLWTMRQFAGFGTPEETNARFRRLLSEGGTGLSVAFDLPTLMGRDPDDPWSQGEVGRCGVSVASLADLEVLFEGIPLEAVSTSMTINAPAAMVFAMYLALAETRDTPWRTLAGTLQNDILKEYLAQKEYIYPPGPSMRLVTDVIAFATAETPRWHPVSISGYHIREAGATAVQELAFALADGLEYVRWAQRAGLDVNQFGPRLSFFFNAESDFFEEIAKFRAARRLWTSLMRDVAGATEPRAWQLRMHAQTAGASLTAQQPWNNVVRTAIQALAAVLGGANSLHTNALDEALALPSDETATLALRTQQILASESGVAETIDPLGGSWYLERLTADLEIEARRMLDDIESVGGMVAAIELGHPQRAIAESAYRAQVAIERGEREVVGVNVATAGAEPSVPILSVDAGAAAARQTERLQAVRRQRDQARVRTVLAALRDRATGTGPLIPILVDCARAYCTIGEMCAELKGAWGEYVETPSI